MTTRVTLPYDTRPATSIVEKPSNVAGCPWLLNPPWSIAVPKWLIIDLFSNHLIMIEIQRNPGIPERIDRKLYEKPLQLVMKTRGSCRSCRFVSSTNTVNCFEGYHEIDHWFSPQGLWFNYITWSSWILLTHSGYQAWTAIMVIQLLIHIEDIWMVQVYINRIHNNHTNIYIYICIYQ